MIMALEIERKFLVCSDAWRALKPVGVSYRQGYMASGDSPATVRVRIAGDKGILTIKGPPQGLTRSEFEYVIPLSDAQAMDDGASALASGPIRTGSERSANSLRVLIMRSEVGSHRHATQHLESGQCGLRNGIGKRCWKRHSRACERKDGGPRSTS